MKKCPTCEKTFEDSMRFCQSDGTPLVAAAEPVDPYKTMVARPDEIAAAIPKTDISKPVESHDEGDVLQIPKAEDPNKTVFVSEEEIRKEMAVDSASEEPVIDIPPAKETPAPPAFIDADLNPVNVPPASSSAEPPIGHLTSPPIPSPFGKSSAADVSPLVPQFKAEPKPEPPSVPSFDETPPPSSFEQQPKSSSPFDSPTPSSPFQAQTPSSPFDSPPASSPFNEPPVVQPSAGTPPDRQMAQSEWTPPPVPEASWQQSGGSGTPPPAAGSGQSKGLAIASLITGILSLLCCNWFIFGIAAIVMGFIARSKAGSNPSAFGGAGLALGGIIAGAVSMILGIIIWVLYFFGFLAGIIGNIR